MNNLQICPSHLSNVATLRWKIQKKVIFNLLFLPFICLVLVLRLGTIQEQRVYLYGHVAACGSSMLQHWLNFSTAWCTVRLISVEKDWKHALM